MIDEIKFRNKLQYLNKLSKKVISIQKNYSSRKEEIIYLLIRNIFEDLESMRILYRNKHYTSCFVIIRSVLEKTLALKKLNDYSDDDFDKSMKYALSNILYEFIKRMDYLNRVNNTIIYLDKIPDLSKYYDNLRLEEKNAFQIAIFMNVDDESNKQKSDLYMKFFGFNSRIKDYKEENIKELRNYYHYLSQFAHPHNRGLMYLGNYVNAKKNLKKNIQNQYLEIHMFILVNIAAFRPTPSDLKKEIFNLEKRLF